MLVYAALEDYYVKSEVYKPNCKSVYQLNFQKKHLCYVNKSGETKLSLPPFIKDGNDAVT